MINLIFKASDGSFHMATSNVNKFYNDNDDFIVKYVEDFDPEYTYSVVDDEVVKGDLIVISDDDAAEIQAAITSTSHHTPRLLAYPSIGEQLDLLYHDIENGTLDNTGEFYTAIKAIKDSNPKAS